VRLLCWERLPWNYQEGGCWAGLLSFHSSGEAGCLGAAEAIVLALRDALGGGEAG
jgi:hypothetical protein